MKIQKYSEKEHAVFILKGIGWAFVNWRSILIVWGSFMATVGTLGGFLLNEVVIPAARPVVRPIVKPHIEPLKTRIDSLVWAADTLEKRVKDLEQNYRLFKLPD